MKDSEVVNLVAAKKFGGDDVEKDMKISRESLSILLKSGASPGTVGEITRRVVVEYSNVLTRVVLYKDKF